MEEEKLITKEIKQTEGKQTKNIYSITEKGKEELENWLMLPIEKVPMRSELLLKLFLSKDIAAKNIMEIIQKEKKDSENNLEKFLEIESFLNSKKNQIDKKNLVLWLSTISYGKHSEESKIKWCEETLKSLEEIKEL
jgi:DNA-binding PadR family transcriptional regulator